MKTKYHGSSSIGPTKITIEEDQWVDVEASELVGVLAWDSTNGVFKYNTSGGTDKYLTPSTTAGYTDFGNGTVSLPSVTFTNDLDCGIYRIGTNNLGIAVNATKILDIATTGLSVVGTTSSSGVFLGPAGAVGAPTYSFTADANTGLINPAAEAIGFVTAGSEKWRLSTTDLLPIGGSNYDVGSATYPVFRVIVGGVGGGCQQPDAAQYGTTPVATVAIKHYGDGKDITTVLTLTNFIVGVIPAANAALAVGNIVYAFPAGAHVESVYSTSLSLTLPGDANAASVVGLGSVIGSTAVAVLNGTATFMDRSTEVTVPTAAAGGAVTKSLAAVTAGAFTGIGLNVAASVKNVFLNAAGTWVVNNAGNLLATGTVTIKWTIM